MNKTEFQLPKVQDFLDKIDCKFPYEDYESGIKVIDEAVSISNYCLYAVIYEIVNVPRNKKIGNDTLLWYINYIEKSYDNDLNIDIITISKKIINNEIYEKDILLYMNSIKQYIGLYIILNLLFFSIDDSTWNISEKFYEISEYWDKELSKVW